MACPYSMQLECSLALLLLGFSEARPQTFSKSYSTGQCWGFSLGYFNQAWTLYPLQDLSEM